MRSPLRYISVKLFFVLMAMLLTVFSIHTYLDIDTSSTNLTNTVYGSAIRASDLIVRSTRYSMQLNRKEDVHETIRTLGSEPGFVGISIYNKLGEVIFSTDSTTVGQKVDLAAEACNICHASGAPLRSVPVDSRMRLYDSPESGPVLGLISPIRNEPACYNGSCHAHSPDQSILGVLDVKMSMAGVNEQVAGVTRRMIVSSIIMTLVVAGLSGAFIYSVVRKPIRNLKRGMDKVAHGDLDASIEVGSSDELGEVAGTFNRMARDLKKARDELRSWTDTLQDRVDEKTAELRQAQSQVIHMEKMASLGKLSASVAHEINNPLFGILTYSKLGLRELAEQKLDTDKLRDYFSVVQSESSRCGDIVKNLLDFARSSGGCFEEHRINEIVEKVLVLLAHHFEMQQVVVHRDLMQGDDTVLCDERQIQQALIAPCINSVEAMAGGGQLTVRTRGDSDTVTVDIIDTGVGIPEETIQSVFEPFFTTKDQKGGLGLGLSVVYGIVTRHQGEVAIKSTPQFGTTLSIKLRRRPALPTEETGVTGEEVEDHATHGKAG